jgi:acyl dehydratase
MKRYATPERLADDIGEPLGESGWRTISQQMVLSFADVTGDHQWIHCDPDRAVAGPFGTPVAHGFLVASLLPSMLDEVVSVDGCRLVLNKEVERLRFAAPVPAGSRVRARVKVESVRRRPRQFVECVFSAAVDVENIRPNACTALLHYLYAR